MFPKLRIRAAVYKKSPLETNWQKVVGQESLDFTVPVAVTSNHIAERWILRHGAGNYLLDDQPSTNTMDFMTFEYKTFNTVVGGEVFDLITDCQDPARPEVISVSPFIDTPFKHALICSPDRYPTLQGCTSFGAAVSNCRLGSDAAGYSNCDSCRLGFFRKSTAVPAKYSCEPCPPNCLKWDDYTQVCLFCQPGHVSSPKASDPTNFECLAFTSDVFPSHVTSPYLGVAHVMDGLAQLEPDTTVNSYQKKYVIEELLPNNIDPQIVGTLIISVFMTTDDVSLTRHKNILLYLDDILEGFRGFDLGQTKSTDELQMHIMKTFFPNKQNTRLKIVAPFAIKNVQVRWKFIPHIPDGRPCFVTKANSKCHLCDNSNFYMEGDKLCVPLKDGQYAVDSYPSFAQYTSNCQHFAATKRCDRSNPSIALVCRDGFYLSASLCQPCSNVRCKSCKQGPAICDECFLNSGYPHLHNGDCLDKCPLGTEASPANSWCLLLSPPAATPESEVRLSLAFDASHTKLVFRFSVPLQLSMFDSKYEYRFNQSLMSVESLSLPVSVVLTSAEAAIFFFPKVELMNEQIALVITERIEYTTPTIRYFVSPQTIFLDSPISIFNTSVQDKKIEQTSKSVSKVVYTIASLNLFTSASTFFSFIKLTQYFDLMLYLDVGLPNNFMAFLRYISKDLFSISFNPFDSITASPCDLRDKLRANEVSCYFLINTGSSLFIFAVVVAVKLALQLTRRLFKTGAENVMTWLDRKLNTRLLFMCLDSVLFDFFLFAVVNLSSLRGSSFFEMSNLIISSCSLLLSSLFAAVTFLYSLASNIDRTKSLLVDQLKRLDLSCIHEGVERTRLTGRFRVSYVQVLLLLAGVSVVFLSSTAQVAVVSLVYLSSFVSIIIKPPHTERKDNFRTIFCEGCQVLLYWVSSHRSGVQHARLCAIFLSIREHQRSRSSVQTQVFERKETEKDPRQ